MGALILVRKRGSPLPGRRSAGVLSVSGVVGGLFVGWLGVRICLEARNASLRQVRDQPRTPSLVALRDGVVVNLLSRIRGSPGERPSSYRTALRVASGLLVATGVVLVAELGRSLVQGSSSGLA